MSHRLHAVKFVSSLPSPQVVHVCRLVDGTTQCILEMMCAPAPNEVRWKSWDEQTDICAHSKDDIIVTGEGTTTCYWDEDYPPRMW